MIDRLITESNDSTKSSSVSSNLVQECEYVMLPSLGIFFTGRYKNTRKVKVKKLSYEEEDILITKSYYDNDTLIEEILSSVIVDKDFPVHEIISIDKDAIFIWLRIGAFGREYISSWECPKCKKTFQATWDLGSFESPDYPKEYIQELKETGSIQVVLKEIKYSLIVPTLERERKVKEFLRVLNKEEEKSQNTLKLLSIIKSIKYGQEDLIETIEEVYSWLLNKKPSISDSRFLQSKAKLINLEIDTKQNVICSKCYEEDFLYLTINKYFFGLLSDNNKYKEYLRKSINFLVFWGKMDYQSAIKLPTALRRYWIKLTQDNLETLYGKKK